MHRAILAALTLAACSAAPEQGNATAVAPAVRTPTPDKPVPGTLKTFKDWTVACDNVKRCAMASLGPEAGEFPDYSLEFARAAGPNGGWELTLDSQLEDTPTTLFIAVDGRRVAFKGWELTGPSAAAIVAAAANGRSLQVLDANGKPRGTIPLNGAAAALRYIDAEQGRADGVTAVVAKGAAPASAVPAAPRQPVLTIMPIGDKGQAPTAGQVARMRKVGECEDVPDGADWSPEAHSLDRGRTLVILPCSAGAYNVIGALFVIDGAKVVPAQTDAPAGFDETGADSQIPVHSVVNGGVDAGELTSYAKGRGLGDCGVSQTFAWDGTRLRLTNQEEMGECRGDRSFIRTWTVQTVRP